MTIGLPTKRNTPFNVRGKPIVETPQHALIQGCLGPDHKVIDMKAFYSALVQALKETQR